MSKQKNKGNNFERAVATDLENIFDLPFNRTFGSGAFLGGKNFHRRAGVSKSITKAALGDIACPEEWDFIIECKSYADINFNGIIKGYCDKLSGWIGEVRYDAESKDNHMVCFKINRAGVYLALPYLPDSVNFLRDVEVPYAMYPYYEFDEEIQENTLSKWYCVISYDYLAGVYNEDYPLMQKAVKQYIVHLATGISN